MVRNEWAPYGVRGLRLDNQTFAAVDDYITGRLLPDDPDLSGALERNRVAGLPEIDVSPAQGKFLHLMARMIGARRILEIGTLGGYSTIWLARALPFDGHLTTLELMPHHAATAEQNLRAAGLDGLVDIRVGPALDSLAGLVAEKIPAFDLIFIDADKPSNPSYFREALRLARKGTVIICDNVVRGGDVIDAASVDPSIIGTRALFDAIAATKRVSATALQTVGSKGWDGFALVLVE